VTLSEELQWRGMIKDKTFEDIKWLDTPRTFYLGVDCNSADSMTIGNLAVFMQARHLVDYGWKAVLLVGGATSLIGDPGGKNEERPLKSREEILHNVEGIKAQVKQLFASKPFEQVDNYDWFKDIGYLEFLRDVGKHYSMTELLQRDFISERLGEGGSGISYAEFSYTMIQGYDYWWLFKHNGVELQIGGSDQWGNMLSGVPLIRKRENAEVHALSMPLVINKTTGKKFGKSEEGAVWLDPAKTSVYKFYQFWLNVDDNGVEDYLKIYTLLGKDELETVIAEFREHPEGRLAQRTLAYEVTKIVHGEARAESAQKVSEVLFGNRSFTEMGTDEMELIKVELPVIKAKIGDQLADLLVEAKLAGSKTEARRFLTDSAVYINGLQFSSEKSTLDEDDVIKGYVLLRRGKNSQVLLEV
jgi:tyrosyl-tRNA synthetase